jgi:pimeloyl-ACP methyl ester carboxylesterase
MSRFTWNRRMSPALRTLRHDGGGDSLLVLLPGAYMTPEHFADNGFFADAAVRHLKLDIVAVDLGLDAVSSGDAIPAVVEQILKPARANYRQVWLGGISLGGLLSLSLNADHPGVVDGLCLIAPYPGSRLTTNAIHRAGGLDIWQPTEVDLTDPEFRVYHWLKVPPAGFPVFVGYGTEDRFAEGMRAIAERVPPATRCALPGNHDWPVWRNLWEHFLNLGHFSA